MERKGIEKHVRSHIDNPDVILIGSGIMSATLGAMLKCIQPDLSIRLYEVTDEHA